MTSVTEHARAGDVAIIGMAGRFPGAATLQDFWRNLRAGVESVTRFSDDDLRRAGVDASTTHNGDSIRAGGVLGDAGRFDATLFAISPAEAELMDPQHRVLLECAWSALDDAGYGARNQAADIGVFAGTSMSSYLLNVLLRNNHAYPVDIDLRTLIGNDKDHLTARIAYRLEPDAARASHRADRLLDLAGRRAPGRARAAQRRVRHGAGRRRLDRQPTGAGCLLRQGRDRLAATDTAGPSTSDADGIVGGSGVGAGRAEGPGRGAGGRRSRSTPSSRARRSTTTARAKVGYTRAQRRRGQAVVIVRGPGRGRRRPEHASATSRRTAPARRWATRSRSPR